MNITLVKLGCPKNDVDAEVMQYVLQRAGHRFVSDPQEADAIIVNTCGFITDAKQQSVNTILEMAQYKQNGRCHTLVVTGCLSQRYSGELFDTLPEVDLMVGVNEYERIDELLTSVREERRLLECSDLSGAPFVPGGFWKAAAALPTSRLPRVAATAAPIAPSQPSVAPIAAGPSRIS